jgi:hypothetical protein
MSQRDEQDAPRSENERPEAGLRPQDAARLRLPSLGLSPSRTDLFATDNDPPPTPPYRLDASKSQEVIDRALPPDYDREHKHEHKPHVRYPDDDGGGLPRPARPPNTREFSAMSSAASIAGSDYDDDIEEEYDWSDDDDLLDQEAKFERTTGQRKKVRTGCGCTRSVLVTASSLS